MSWNLSDQRWSSDTVYSVGVKYWEDITPRCTFPPKARRKVLNDDIQSLQFS